MKFSANAFTLKDGKPDDSFAHRCFCAVLFAFVFTNLLGLGIGGLALGASLATMIVSIILIYSMNKNSFAYREKSFGFWAGYWRRRSFPYAPLRQLNGLPPAATCGLIPLQP